jgi:hypothetical protein
MDWNRQDDELLRSYLLGELAEEEVDRLERRLLEDDELFKLGEAMEADLLAAYARGELAAAEGERVLPRLASSAAGRARLALARSLNAVASESQPLPAPVVPLRRRAVPAPRPGLRWAALAAAVLVALAGALWFALQTTRQSGSRPIANKISTPTIPNRPGVPEKPAHPIVNAPVAKEPRTAPDRLARRDERTAAKPPARPEPLKSVIALSLTTLRGAGAVEEFRVPAGAGIVEIQLDLEGLEDLKSFHAAVRSQKNETVWEKSGLKAKRLDWGTALVLDIPAERLPSGSYEVTVTAGTEELTQPFKVIRENR